MSIDVYMKDFSMEFLNGVMRSPKQISTKISFIISRLRKM